MGHLKGSLGSDGSGRGVRMASCYLNNILMGSMLDSGYGFEVVRVG
jgi:hypothetical protein